MSPIRLSKKLQKITGEIRFRPNFDTWNLCLQIGKELEGDFEEWRMPQGKQSEIVLYSPSHKRLLAIKYDTVIYINEGVDDYADLTRLHKKVLKKNEGAGIREFRHVGVRSMTLFESNLQYSELVQLLQEKLFNTKEELKNISAPVLRDVAFSYDGEANGLSNHVRIGPVIRDEGYKAFRASFDLAEIPDTNYVFLDVDAFQEKDITKENAIETLEKCISENKRIVESYLAYLTSV